MTEKDTVNIKQELKKALPFITIIILVCLVNKFLIFNTTIPTSSMISTLNIGDCLFGNRLAYIFSNPKRGDIITFKAPDDKDTIYVKRIIGIEGDMAGAARRDYPVPCQPGAQGIGVHAQGNRWRAPAERVPFRGRRRTAQARGTAAHAGRLLQQTRRQPEP